MKTKQNDKEEGGKLISMLLGTLGANLIEDNKSAGIDVIRADEGTIKTDGNF